MEDFFSEVPQTTQNQGIPMSQNYDNQPIIADEAFDPSQQGSQIII